MSAHAGRPLRAGLVTEEPSRMDDTRSRQRDRKRDLVVLDVVATAPGLLLKAVVGVARGVGAVVSRVLP